MSVPEGCNTKTTKWVSTGGIKSGLDHQSRAASCPLAGYATVHFAALYHASTVQAPESKNSSTYRDDHKIWGPFARNGQQNMVPGLPMNGEICDSGRHADIRNLNCACVWPLES